LLKNNNINIIGVFRDNGVSAKDMKNQFGLNYICEIIKRGECILFYDISRFSRSVVQAIQKLEYLRQTIGAIAHSVHDGISWNNIATSRASFRQNLSNSQLHSEVVSEKVLSSIGFRRDKGDYVGGVSYGYKTDIVDGVRKLIKNNQEIDVIKEIVNTATEIFIKQFDEMDLDDDTKGSKKSKRVFSHDTINKFSKSDITWITDTINKKYSNRNNKPFTCRFIKKYIDKLE